jgi:3-oxoacyl-[acyl-carrier protein] reductase
MIGRKFADEGASVVVADQDEEASDSAVAELKTTGAECTSYRLDVSVADETEGLVEAVRERFGHIDVLANCAGVSRFGPIEELRLEWWQRVIEVNLNGLFYCCYAVAKVMMEQKRGSRASLTLARWLPSTGFPTRLRTLPPNTEWLVSPKLWQLTWDHIRSESTVFVPQRP